MILNNWYVPVKDLRMLTWISNTVGPIAFIQGKAYQCKYSKFDGHAFTFKFDSESSHGHRIIENSEWYWSLEPVDRAERFAFHIIRAGRAT